MDRLEAMSIIIAVNEAGSISAASRRLKSPVATISRKITELESRLKTKLFQRTSRRMLLTEAGRAYIEACKRILDQVDEAEKQVSGEYIAPKGDICLTAPWGIGHTYLLPLAHEFLEAYPDISLRLVLTDRIVDTIAENIDIAIRVGAFPPTGMAAVQIGSIRIVVCASPSYLKKRGRPKRLDDLQNHDCIVVDEHARPEDWKFVRGKQVTVASIRPRLCVNTSEAAILAAIMGGGLTRVMSYKIKTARRERKLAIVLEEFEPEPLPVHVIHLPRKKVPVKLRVLLDWMIPRLSALLAR